jgi:hypothetical protein
VASSERGAVCANYAQKLKTPRPANRRGVSLKWCAREDLNFHGFYPTATSTLRVYQFRHGAHPQKARGIAGPDRIVKRHSAQISGRYRLEVICVSRAEDLHRNPVALDDDFAARNRVAIRQNPDRLVLIAVHGNHRAAAHAQKLRDRHRRLSKDNRYLDFDGPD